MPKHSSFHFHIEWAKERLDEMDASLASLERHARAKEAEFRAKADQLIAALRKRRDQYWRASDTLRYAADEAWPRDKAMLDKLFEGFSKDLNGYVEKLGTEAALQRALFQDSAAAQRNALRDAVERLEKAGKEFATHRGSEIGEMLQQMRADASDVEAKIQKLNRAGNRSWAELSEELAESRAAFDNAVLRLVTDVFDDEAAVKSKKKHDSRPSARS